ncbi:MAG: orotate phosphoribosyltransferase [Deltaproteobacteria bacterium]|nr:orotate phosphoribosyltransferase [Deltaproteobacteria bacterium]MBW2265056.1 orotate phosphoribosyltransferase [Deltaproteobacteria bacterium]MBW2317177.1 orotate phosphoribosyltransferase [Deltaproteobacteria bacterium]MBW2600334.1 orotate phosphoribosyltransferase [Deltaproteobacteria bacterium]
MKQQLVEMLCEKSFMYSKDPIYKLASGRQSQFYVNCRPTTLHPKGMYLVGHLVFNCIERLNVQGVGGLTFGADPIAMATAFTSYMRKKPLKAFSVRKTQKDHGIVKWVEGDITRGEKVVIVEDVVTTGGSTIKALDRVQAEGLHVEKVVVLVDRQEGGMEAIREHVNSVEAIVTIEDLMRAHRHKG